MLENLKNVLNEIKDGNNLGEEITLVGATKFVPVETINLAGSNGLKVVAENKVQEFREKTDKLSPELTQHFIGHLQTNKAKYLVGKVALIQSVDSLDLLRVISELAVKKGVTQDVLLEVNVGQELSKSGFLYEETESALNQSRSYKGVRVLGLMAMLPNTDDDELKAGLCRKMRALFDKLKEKHDDFKYLSIGMSGDYKIAIKNGSNMIRLGSLLFGQRYYNK